MRTYPWKLQYRYDNPIGGGAPIQGTKAFANETGAASWARQVHDLGGTATVKYRDPATGKETWVASYGRDDS